MWRNYPPTALCDGLGIPIPMGCYVQLIWDSAGDGIDDPNDYQRSGKLCCDCWISAGLPPLDDDVFVQVAGPINVTTAIGSGGVPVGYFYEENITPINPGLEAGEYLYTRFFTAPKDEIYHWHFYGQTELWQVPTGEELEYVIHTGSPYIASHPICIPEPSVFLLVGCSLIFLLLKLMRK